MRHIQNNIVYSNLPAFILITWLMEKVKTANLLGLEISD